MLVLKFGGSSVDCAASILRVAEVIHELRERQVVVVVSAMAKTTEDLLRCAEAAAAGISGPQSAASILHKLKEFHWRESHLAIQPSCYPVLDKMLESLFGELDRIVQRIAASGRLLTRDSDAVASYGELLSSTILFSTLNQSRWSRIEAAWLDCRKVIVTDDTFGCAQPLYPETRMRLQKMLLPQVKAGKIVVLGGYVGANSKGITTTLGREGSDFSAAIVGSALRAQEIQIWTDVDGMMTADPRLVASARRIRSLSFAEALELSCSGSPKPHYRALEPASRARVPIRILNSRKVPDRNRPSEGTLIGKRSATASPGIKSISYLSFPHRVSLRAKVSGHGQIQLGRVADLCNRFRPTLMILNITSDRIDLAVRHEERFLEVQAALEAIGKLEIHPSGGVLTMVSEDLARDPTLVQQAMESVRPLEPAFVTAGAACSCIRCLVNHDVYPTTLAELHHRIFGDQPEVVG